MSSGTPPPGPYVPVEDGNQLVELVGQGGPIKYLRLSTHSVFRIPQDGLNPAPYTAAVIDCQGQWIDMRGMSAYAVQPLSKLSFFSCTISIPEADSALAADTSFHYCNIVHPCEVLSQHPPCERFIVPACVIILCPARPCRVCSKQFHLVSTIPSPSDIAQHCTTT